MNTENLSTLKIHKLTQAQYDRELAAGNIKENELYLTPDETTNVPTKVSDLENDADFVSAEYVDKAIEERDTSLTEQVGDITDRIDEMESTISGMTVKIAELSAMIEEVLV